jgi:hypothetical protein
VLDRSAYKHPRRHRTYVLQATALVMHRNRMRPRCSELPLWPRSPAGIIAWTSLSPLPSRKRNRIGDQADTAFLSGVIEEFGPPDIVLDDGGHVMSHVVASFSWLYPRVAPDGIYMVEDLHTAYWPEYEGGLCRPGSFIQLCKHLIDELNADWSRGELPPSAFTRTTQSMHFYDSMAVFERGRTSVKYAPMIPPLEAAKLEADCCQLTCCPPLKG